MNGMRLNGVKSSAIRTGDIVLAHGMRVRIDETRTYASTGSNRGEYPTVYAHQGTVLNLAEVIAAQIVPPSFLTTERWEEGQGWVTDRRDRWVVQGNDLARWTVERENGQEDVKAGDEVTWRSGQHMNRATVAHTTSAACCIFTQTGSILPIPWDRVTEHHPKGEG